MKKILLACAAAGMSVAAAAPAAAQWQSINQRQRMLSSRIEQGMRNGSLTRAEAGRLRTRFANLNRLEYRYRRSGGQLTRWERSDLDRRFDSLSRAVRYQKHDRQMRR